MVMLSIALSSLTDPGARAPDVITRPAVYLFTLCKAQFRPPKLGFVVETQYNASLLLRFGRRTCSFAKTNNLSMATGQERTT